MISMIISFKILKIIFNYVYKLVSVFGVYTYTFCESGERCEGLGAVGIGSGKLLTWVLGKFGSL